MADHHLSAAAALRPGAWAGAALLALISVFGELAACIQGATVYYSDYSAGVVYRTDGTTRTTLVTGLIQPMKIVLAGDGSFYVAMQSGFTPSGQAVRHFSAAGAPIGPAFATDAHHTGLTLGPDGQLYVSSTDNTFAHGYVDRYNLAGNAPAPSSFNDHSPAQYTQYSAGSYFEGLIFGPDGHLYASGNGHSSIDVYQGPSEAAPGAFIKSLSGAGHTYGITFGPDGHLYAGDTEHNIIYRYDGSAFTPFVSGHLNKPIDQMFGPDGDLYVTNFNGRNITRFQGPGGASPGAFIDVFASQASGNPSYMAVAVPEPRTWMTIAVGMMGLLISRRRNRVSEGVDYQLWKWVGCDHRRARSCRPRATLLLIMCTASYIVASSSSTARGVTVYYTQPFTNSVERTDGVTTKTVVSGVTAPTGIALGPDGNLYVSEEGGDKLERFTSSGVRVGSAFGTGRRYVGLAFGADGLLYASSTFDTYGRGYLERFNPATGAAMGSAFAAADPAQYTPLNTATYYEGITAGPDGTLYGAGAHSGSVDVYQGPFGSNPGMLISRLTFDAGGSDVAIGPDGAVYAGDYPNNRILRYDGTKFQPFATTSINQPVGLDFGPNGDLYVSNGGVNNILRFQGPGGAQPGALIGVFATTASRPSRLLVVPEPTKIGLTVCGLMFGVCFKGGRADRRPSRAHTDDGSA